RRLLRRRAILSGFPPGKRRGGKANSGHQPLLRIAHPRHPKKFRPKQARPMATGRPLNLIGNRIHRPGNVRRCNRERLKMKVEQLMKRDVKVCRTDDTLNSATRLMWECDCGCIPVISTDGDGALVGIVTDRDVAIAAYTQGKPLSAIPVSTAMARNVIACHASDGISQAEALMRDNQVRRLPVVDRQERLVGILSLN